MRVMLVDDHPLVRAAVAQAIGAPDVEVVGEAGTAEEALGAAPRLRPDVVLLDINLPGMSGLELVGELRRLVPNAKIVMLTVSTAQREVDEALLNGAAGFLTKDLAPEALRRAVRGLREGNLAMSRRHAADSLVRLASAAQRRAQRGPDDSSALSRREREVLRLVSEGLSNREIAAALTLSPRTIERHVSSVLHKLEVPNRAAAAHAYREGAGSPI